MDSILSATRRRTQRAVSRLLVAVFTLALSAPPSFAQDDEPITLKRALAEGDPALSLLYRYEFVGSDAFELDAHASTLRTTLSYRTLPWRGLSLFAEAQNVSALFGDGSFDNGGAGHLGNGVTDRPVVADPSQTRMQQVYLRYEAADSVLDLGRREIIYGDHRFIGNVTWRQNHQTFDAIHATSRALARTRLSYDFVGNVVRVNGGEQEMASHFLNGVVDVREKTSLELFGYLLDYQEEANRSLSSQTYGFRLLGAEPVSSELTLFFEAEYAKQLDFRDNPSELDADYLELVGGVGIEGWLNIRLGRELLGAADGGLAFQTPLATLHKFNGWADVFLRTPADGLVDRYVAVDGKLGRASWLATYHDFSAADGGSSYGTELDAQLTYGLPWQQLLATKFARYREDGFASHVSKFWVWTRYTF